MDYDAPYVEQMKRKLKTKLNEHIKNIRLESQNTVISDHISEYDHSIFGRMLKF